MDSTWTAYGSPESEEIEIPDAGSPDLISALLSFDASELAGTDERAEDLLVRKAAEIRGWKLDGSHPRFLAEHWIEVVVTGRLQGYCRILNGRTHSHLNPFTLDTLIREVERLRQWMRDYKTPEDFTERFLRAYDELSDSYGPEVELHEIYKLLVQRQPNYRRECFGLDFVRSLKGRRSLMGRNLSLSCGDGPSTRRYALVLSPTRPAQVADRIRIAQELKSLDI